MTTEINEMKQELKLMRKEMNDKLDFITNTMVAVLTGDLKKSDL